CVCDAHATSKPDAHINDWRNRGERIPLQLFPRRADEIRYAHANQRDYGFVRDGGGCEILLYRRDRCSARGLQRELPLFRVATDWHAAELSRQSRLWRA